MIFIVVILLNISAHAEYRAFELGIVNQDGKQTLKVTGTLDPNQYPGYYHLDLGSSVLLLDTWMCWGYTGEGQEICPNPKKQNNLEQKTRTPASSPL